MSHELDEHLRRTQARRALAGRQPIVEVTGIVGSRGVGRVRARGEPWEEVIHVPIWRVGDGPIEPGALRLTQMMAENDWPHGSLEKTPHYTVFAIAARILRDADEPLGLVAGRARIVEPDRLLAEALEHLRTPKTFDDPLLGRFTEESGLWWRGRAKWLGTECDIMLDDPDNLATAHALWADQAGWTERARARAVTKLLRLKNKHWLAADEAPVSPAAFRSRLEITCVSVGAAGAFELSFDDGGLFSGHEIEVKGTLRRGLTAAEIAG